jgi:hypothetical protein
MDRRLIFLGFVVLSLFLTVAVLLGISIGVGTGSELEFPRDTLSSWVTALSTTVIAILTIVLAKETWELRDLQIKQMERIRKDSMKPSISVMLKDSSVGVSFMNVHVVNNGVGVAQNIRFKFRNENPERQDVYDGIKSEIDKLAFLSEGISSLGPGQEQISFLLNFNELSKKFQDALFEYCSKLEILFEDLEGEQYHTIAWFRFSEYKGIRQIGGDTGRKIATSLEKLQRDIGHLAVGFRKIKVDLFTKEDREAENERISKISENLPKDQGESS